MKKLQESNLTLKLEVIEIRRITSIEEEEARAYRTGDDMLMRAAGGESPTPVTAGSENKRYHQCEYKSKIESCRTTGELERERLREGTALTPMQLVDRVGCLNRRKLRKKTAGQKRAGS